MDGNNDAEHNMYKCNGCGTLHSEEWFEDEIVGTCCAACCELYMARGFPDDYVKPTEQDDDEDIEYDEPDKLSNYYGI